MEKQIIENLIVHCDKAKKIKIRDELLEAYVKLWPQEFDECSLYEIVERNGETIH